MKLPRLVVTAGEPAGIGPDLCLELARRNWDAELIFVADPALLRARAKRLGLNISVTAIDPDELHDERASHKPGSMRVVATDLSQEVVPGRLRPDNASSVIQSLTVAARGCIEGRFDAMVTAPVNKAVINEAGIAFSGHTEFLAQLCQSAQPVMLLVAGKLRVALVTTHLPLSEVSRNITPDRLRRVIRVLHDGLQDMFGIAQPVIAVCGLNPHAGEGGHLGREEIDTIGPLLDEMRQRGLALIGPLPADTAFTPKGSGDADSILCMYHDQGLPVLKHAGFGKAVNVTLGLPIIRTSVDHGTALELAGTGKADPGSLVAATWQAIDLVARRKAR